MQPRDIVGLIPWLAVGGSLLVIAGVILVRQRIVRVAQLFCLMISLVAVWLLSFGLMFHAPGPSIAALLGRIGLSAVALMPAAIYEFTTTALRIVERRRMAIALNWGLGALFVAGIAITDLVLEPGVRRFDWGYYPEFTTTGGVAFVAYFGAILLLHLFEYAGEYRRTADVTRRGRLRKLAITFAIVYFATIDLIPLFGIDRRPIGYIPVVLFVLFAWRSIQRHRFIPITAARAAGEILDTMGDALFVVDSEGRIRVVNRAVQTTFGYSEAEILGKSIDILDYIDPDESPSPNLRQTLLGASARDKERIFRDRDGHPINVSLSVSPLRERRVGGGAVVIARDIRERKRGEEELRQFALRLQQSNRELEDFAYVASHDLQEPLRKIQAFGDRLGRKYGSVLTAEGKDYLRRMQNAANRMQTLINDLLLLSRITTRAQPFLRVELQTIVEEVIRDLEVSIAELDATVSAEDLPAIDADPIQMRQLFQNLIANGLKFHREGVPPRVSITASTGPAEVEITVADNGIGFDPKYAERVFTIFERLHGRDVYDGTGIGLAICKRIVERHGGTIEARGMPGAGAMFVVRLPMIHWSGGDSDEVSRETDHDPGGG
ncbi:MAG: PAS domain S-box protein [Acidobacteria bacterium]|nr:PAS domain S-box protein [Acidobacteriota bacterium]